MTPHNCPLFGWKVRKALLNKKVYILPLSTSRIVGICSISTPEHIIAQTREISVTYILFCLLYGHCGYVTAWLGCMSSTILWHIAHQTYIITYCVSVCVLVHVYLCMCDCVCGCVFAHVCACGVCLHCGV